MISRHFLYAIDPRHNETYILLVIDMLSVFAYRYEDDCFHYSEDLTDDFCFNHELEYRGVSNVSSVAFLIDIEYGKDTQISTHEINILRGEIIDPIM